MSKNATDPTDFTDVFIQSSRKLVAEYEATVAALEHRGLKGTAREAALTDFLQKNLPVQFKCGTGEVVSIAGRSKQVDVIVFHSTRAPALYRAAEIQVVPIEATLAVIEVKTTLNAAELKMALENIQSVKALKAVAYYGKEDPLNGAAKKSVGNPVPGYIFAYDSISLEELLKNLEAEQRDVDPALWVDGIFILKKGQIVPRDNKTNERVPTAAGTVYVPSEYVDTSLLSFFLILWDRLILAWTPPIRLEAYFPNFSPNGRALGAK